MTYNNKLIGARNSLGSDPPIDGNGHGTHTASTASGNFVNDANVFGQAKGTVVGIAPLAHLAIYKVCDENRSCPECTIYAGIEAAIKDGVDDVISLSVGFDVSSPFFDDSIAMASFNAIQKGSETKEELLSNLLSRSDTSAAMEPGTPPAINGGMSQSLKGHQPELRRGSNFALQLFQRTLEETLDSFQKSIHEDMRNLHIEMSNMMSSKNQAELMKEIQSLRQENQQLRQLL